MPELNRRIREHRGVGPWDNETASFVERIGIGDHVPMLRNAIFRLKRESLRARYESALHEHPRRHFRNPGTDGGSLKTGIGGGLTTVAARGFTRVVGTITTGRFWDIEIGKDCARLNVGSSAPTPCP
jgi:hypothetical protein